MRERERERKREKERERERALLGNHVHDGSVQGTRDGALGTGLIDITEQDAQKRDTKRNEPMAKSAGQQTRTEKIKSEKREGGEFVLRPRRCAYARECARMHACPHSASCGSLVHLFFVLNT